MADTTSPFKGQRSTAKSAAAMNVLYRFTKPGEHWAEIRERKIAQFRGLEFIVFVDGSLLESQKFHNGREAEYPAAIEARIKQFTDGGWHQVGLPDSAVSS